MDDGMNGFQPDDSDPEIIFGRTPTDKLQPLERSRSRRRTIMVSKRELFCPAEHSGETSGEHSETPQESFASIHLNVSDSRACSEFEGSTLPFVTAQNSVCTSVSNSIHQSSDNQSESLLSESLSGIEELSLDDCEVQFSQSCEPTDTNILNTKDWDRFEGSSINDTSPFEPENAQQEMLDMSDFSRVEKANDWDVNNSCIVRRSHCRSRISEIGLPRCLLSSTDSQYEEIHVSHDDCGSESVDQDLDSAFIGETSRLESSHVSTGSLADLQNLPEESIGNDLPTIDRIQERIDFLAQRLKISSPRNVVFSRNISENVDAESASTQVTHVEDDDMVPIGDRTMAFVIELKSGKPGSCIPGFAQPSDTLVPVLSEKENFTQLAAKPLVVKHLRPLSLRHQQKATPSKSCSLPYRKLRRELQATPVLIKSAIRSQEDQ